MPRSLQCRRTASASVSRVTFSCSIAGLTAYKNFFNAVSKASKTTDEAHPNPYDVYAQGLAASMIGQRRRASASSSAIFRWAISGYAS